MGKYKVLREIGDKIFSKNVEAKFFTSALVEVYPDLTALKFLGKSGINENRYLITHFNQTFEVIVRAIY